MTFPINIRQVRIGMLLGATLGVVSGVAGTLPSCPPASHNAANREASSGHYIWFHANFTASGIPRTGATIDFTNSRITFTADREYTVTAPNGMIIFDPAATCASTTFDVAANTWKTRVPVTGADEVFLSALAFPVPASLASADSVDTDSVAWHGNFTTNAPGVHVGWKWSATEYTSLNKDYNALSVNPAHSASNADNSSGHAGTPAICGNGSELAGSSRGVQSVNARLYVNTQSQRHPILY